jgi:predicted PurR-regulated permease PerM
MADNPSHRRPSDNMNAAAPATRYEIAAWILAGVALIAILSLHLLTALVGGLLVYELVHVLTRVWVVRRFASTGARMVAVVVLSVIVVALITGLVFGIVAFLRSDVGSAPALMTKLAEILDTSRAHLPQWIADQLPADAYSAKDRAVEWLRKHAADLESMGRGLGRLFVELVIGMIIGAMVSLHDVAPDEPLRPLGAALLERAHRLAEAFRRFVFAQVRIAAINAILTGIYLIVALPLMGVHLPYGKTMILVTFLCGLIPVVGNLISNTVIVLISLSQSALLAFASLVFLIVIHKLEYFLNARIVGTQIGARPWELLIAMLVFEAAFGATGIVAAPIYYAYVKDELSDRGLI